MGFITKVIKAVTKPFLKSIENRVQAIGKGFVAEVTDLITNPGAYAMRKILEPMLRPLRNMIESTKEKLGKIGQLLSKLRSKEAIVGSIMKMVHYLKAIAIGFLIICLAVICIYFLVTIASVSSNLFSFSYGFDKTSYYDNDLFTAVKNKELMEENIYEKAAETSFYQRFVDAELTNLTKNMIPKDLQDLESSGLSSKKVIEEAQKSYTGFYTLDSRLTIHDANFGAMGDYIQANTIDTDLESSAELQGYLRDYFNKETNFQLSDQFLMQLNNKAFAKSGAFGEDLELIYPETFTKPVAFNYDFNRMDYVSDGEEKVWSEYTYVTQRIVDDFIGNKFEDILLNKNSEKSWANYWGYSIDWSNEIQDSDEGKICSFPSPYVWEYIVIDRDDYKILTVNSTTGGATEENIDNDYDSQYLTLYNDETGAEEIAKFYYKINVPSSSSGTIDCSLGKKASSYSFSSPYASIGGNDLDNALKNAVSVVSENGLEYYEIPIPDGYRLVDDVCFDEDGNLINRTVNSVKVRKDYNKAPQKHLQLVDIENSEGEIDVYSQNLINYKYYRFKTITESYRNKQEYIDGWSSFLLSDDNTDFYTQMADRNFWDALWNRVSATGTSIAKFIHGDSQNLEVSGSEADRIAERNVKIIASYPEPVLNLSLYLYEKSLKDGTVGDNDSITDAKDDEDNVWKYDYSVNAYFSTDNFKLDNQEDFQKFYYVAEELELARNSDGSWDTNSIIYKQLEKIINDNNYAGGPFVGCDTSTLLTNLYNKLVVEGEADVTALDIGDVFSSIFSGSSISLGIDVLQSNQLYMTLNYLTNEMSTKYLNVGTTKSNGDVVGGGNRLGEYSMISTLNSSKDIYDEVILYSNMNGSTSDYSGDKKLTFKMKSWSNSFSDGWKNFWGKAKSFFLGKDYTEVDSSAEYSVMVDSNEHSHLQSDYYIGAYDSSKQYTSNIYSEYIYRLSDWDKTLTRDTTNDLPLELKSVRDYGLGSVLNYVDSVVVKFRSGVYEDEHYLGTQIANEVISSFGKTYPEKAYTGSASTVSESGIRQDGQTGSSYKKYFSMVYNGYYPKEMKDAKNGDSSSETGASASGANEILTELFEQNNKKKILVNLAENVDNKITELATAYDEYNTNVFNNASGDNNIYIKVASGKRYITQKIDIKNSGLFGSSGDIDYIDNIIIPTYFDKGEGSTAIEDRAVIFPKLYNEGTLSTYPSGYKIAINNTDVSKLANVLIFSNGSDFGYYTPTLNVSSGISLGRGNISRVSQLLFPKRYYRTWASSQETSDDGILNGLLKFVLNTNVNFETTVKMLSKKEALSATYAANYATIYDFAKNNDVSVTGNNFIAASDAITSSSNTTASQGGVASVEQYEGTTTTASGDVVDNDSMVYYLCDTYAPNSGNFGGTYSDYVLLTDNNLEKVYLIDEVVTFAGKFMYTYKDKLVALDTNAESDLTTNIIGSYATDRYVFLDRWDVKLVADRVVDVGFLFFKTELFVNVDKDFSYTSYDDSKGEYNYTTAIADDYKPNDNTELITLKQFIERYNKLISKKSIFSAIANFLDYKCAEILFAYVDDAATSSDDVGSTSDVRMQDEIKDLFILAIPTQYVKNNTIKSSLKDMFRNAQQTANYRGEDGDSLSVGAGGVDSSEVLQELIDYTNYIAEGFFLEDDKSIGYELLSPNDEDNHVYSDIIDDKITYVSKTNVDQDNIFNELGNLTNIPISDMNSVGLQYINWWRNFIIKYGDTTTIGNYYGSGIYEEKTRQVQDPAHPDDSTKKVNETYYKKKDSTTVSFKEFLSNKTYQKAASGNDGSYGVEITTGYNTMHPINEPDWGDLPAGSTAGTLDKLANAYVDILTELQDNGSFNAYDNTWSDVQGKIAGDSIANYVDLGEPTNPVDTMDEDDLVITGVDLDGLLAYIGNVITTLGPSIDAGLIADTTYIDDSISLVSNFHDYLTSDFINNKVIGQDVTLNQFTNLIILEMRNDLDAYILTELGDTSTNTVFSSNIREGYCKNMFNCFNSSFTSYGNPSHWKDETTDKTETIGNDGVSSTDDEPDNYLGTSVETLMTGTSFAIIKPLWEIAMEKVSDEDATYFGISSWDYDGTSASYSNSMYWVFDTSLKIYKTHFNVSDINASTNKNAFKDMISGSSLIQEEEGFWTKIGNKIKDWWKNLLELAFDFLDRACDKVTIDTTYFIQCLHLKEGIFEDIDFDKLYHPEGDSYEDAEKISGFFNQYVTVLDIKHKSSNEWQEYVPYHFTTYETGFGAMTDSETKQQNVGTCEISCTAYTFTLKIADEMALDIDAGRYYSQASNLGRLDATDSFSNANVFANGSTSSSSDTQYIEMVSDISPYSSGELYELSYKDIMNASFLSAYNAKSGQSVSMEDWEKAWEPQLKIFDSVKNIKYNNDDMKEFFFGTYQNKDNNDYITYDEDAAKSNTNGWFYDLVIKSGGKYKFQNSNIKVSYVDLTKDSLLHKPNHFVDNKYDDSSYTDSSDKNYYNYNFLYYLFNLGSASSYRKDLLISDMKTSLRGYKLTQGIESSVKEAVWPEVNYGTEDRAFSGFADKNTSIDVTSNTEYVKVPASNEWFDATAFTEVLNDLYNQKLFDKLKAENADIGSSMDEYRDLFNITGFILVPRIADRRDEPTTYPLHRYFIGAYKQILPQQTGMYFEGQTYDSWINRMTIDESSSEEEISYFEQESTRVSKYLRSYLKNFECYVPYNIVSDSDLEVRGTAGYGDLMTNYTLTPEYTQAYTQYFVNEASKDYWANTLTAYDIDIYDLAQLLQGVAEVSLTHSGEDALNILRSTCTRLQNGETINSRVFIKTGTINDNQTVLPANTEENIRILQNAIVGTINRSGASSLNVSLEGEDGAKHDYLLPIVGIGGLDDYFEENQEDVGEQSDTNSFANFAFLGNFSSSFKSAIESLEGGTTNVTWVTCNDDVQALDFYNNNVANLNFTGKDGIVVMLGAGDAVKSDYSSITTIGERYLISKVINNNPKAKVYVVLYPGFSETYKNSYNKNMLKYNSYIKNFISTQGLENIEIIDLSDDLADASWLSMEIADNCIDYNSQSKVFINQESLGKISRGKNNEITVEYKLSEILKENIFSGNYANEVTYTNGYTKSTSSIGGTVKEEITLNCTKNSNDDRLNISKSIAYLSTRLFKYMTSGGDFMKGLYMYCYGVDYVNALGTVTADTASNLIKYPEHGLFYNPTEQDVQNAWKDVIFKDDSTGFTNKELELDHRGVSWKEAYSVQRIKDMFSYLQDINARKFIATVATKTGATLSSSTINIDSTNSSDYYPDGIAAFDDTETINVAKQEIQEMYLNPGQEKGFQYAGAFSYMGYEDWTDKSIDTTIRTYTRQSSITWGKGRTLINEALANGSENGMLYVVRNGYKCYLAALGTAWMNAGTNENLGGIYAVIVQDPDTEEYRVFLVCQSDAKADRHTDTHNQYTAVVYAAEAGYACPRNDNYCVSRLRYQASRGQSTEKITCCAVEFTVTSDYTSCPEYFKGQVVAIQPINLYDGTYGTSTGKITGKSTAEEIWEEDYMKYQNTGLIDYSNHMHEDDVDELISSTAMYRKDNNYETSDYDYNLLDFFSSRTKSTEEEYNFNGDLKTSLLKYGMTYLGAHYSQGASPNDNTGGQWYLYTAPNGIIYDRTSYHLLIAKEKKKIVPHNISYYRSYNVDEALIAKADSVTKEMDKDAEGNKYAFDCSSFGTAAYLGMGYVIPGATIDESHYSPGTCASIRSGFNNSNYSSSVIPNTFNPEEFTKYLEPGDLLITTTHTMIYMGLYLNNLDNQFDSSMLKVISGRDVWYTGQDALDYANSKVAGNYAILHCGPSNIDEETHSCVNIKEFNDTILTTNDCRIYRVFPKVLDQYTYSYKYLTDNNYLYPTVFTSTTLENNPYLVYYIENSASQAGSGVHSLNWYIAKGYFTKQDVANAKSKIARITYTDTEIED